MRNLSISFVLCLFSISVFAQKVGHVKVYCTEDFNPKTSITVQPPNPDDIGLADIIKNNLVMNGFKVISETVAKQQLELYNKKQMSDTSLNQKITLDKATYIKSVYVITFTYSYMTSIGYYLTALNGQVVDLANDGEIVATFSYQHSVFGARGPKVVAETLCKELKQKKQSK